MMTLPKIGFPNQFTKTERPCSTFVDASKECYAALLLREEWRRKRRDILLRDCRRCRSCGREEHLEVHHKQYHIDRVTGRFKMPWQYDPKYLITLCVRCHKAGHKRYKIPTFLL